MKLLTHNFKEFFQIRNLYHLEICPSIELLDLLLSTHSPVTAFSVTSSKGKAVPLQAWSGSEGSRKLRFPDFMTTAQDGSKVVSPTHRPPLPPGNTPGTHFC